MNAQGAADELYAAIAGAVDRMIREREVERLKNRLNRAFSRMLAQNHETERERPSVVTTEHDAM